MVVISAGLDALGRVVLGAVHELGHAVAVHVLGGVGAEEEFQKLRLKALGVQPPEIMFRPDDDRHPGVHGGDHGIGLGGDEGEGVHDLAGDRHIIVQRQFAVAGRPDPAIPEPGHAEQAIVLEREPVRLLATGCGLPFVKTVGRHQTALRRKRLSECGLLGNRIHQREQPSCRSNEHWQSQMICHCLRSLT